MEYGLVLNGKKEEIQNTLEFLDTAPQDIDALQKFADCAAYYLSLEQLENILRSNDWL